MNPRRFPLWRFLFGLILGALMAPFIWIINRFPSAQVAQAVGGLSMDFTQFLDALVRLLNDASFLPFAVAFVLTLTALLKFVIPEHLIRPQTLAVVIQVVVWLVYTVAKERYGVDELTFTNVLQLLTAIGSALLMVVTGGAITQRAYLALEKHDVPFWGQSQPMRLRKATA